MDACCAFCKNFVLHILFSVGVAFGVIIFGYGIYVLIEYDQFDLNGILSFALVWLVSITIGIVITLLESLSIAILCTLVKKCKSLFLNSYLVSLSKARAECTTSLNFECFFVDGIKATHSSYINHISSFDKANNVTNLWTLLSLQ